MRVGLRVRAVCARPRPFVQAAALDQRPELARERLALMEYKLYRFMTPLGILAVLLGFWLWFGFGDRFATAGWLHVKTTLVLFLIAYHLYCGKLMRDLAAGRNTRSHVWFRVFNEVPVLVLFAVVFLAVVRPF